MASGSEDSDSDSDTEDWASTFRRETEVSFAKEDSPKKVSEKKARKHKSDLHVEREKKEHAEDNIESRSKQRVSGQRRTVQRKKSDDIRKESNVSRFFNKFKARRSRKEDFGARHFRKTTLNEETESYDSYEPTFQIVSTTSRRANERRAGLVGGLNPRDSIASRVYSMIDDFNSRLDAAPFEILPVPEALTREQIKLFFRRGFRPDHINLDGKVGFLPSVDSTEEDVIYLSDSEQPIDFLIRLGFDADDAAVALEQRGVKTRLQAALVEARIWVNSVSRKQGSLMFFLSQMIHRKAIRFFLPMVEAIVNKRITSASQVDAFMRVLVNLEETNSYLIPGSIDVQRVLTVDHAKNKKEILERLMELYNAANEVSEATRGRHLDEKEMLLLEYLAHRFRPSLKNHMHLIAAHIGRGQLRTKMQLDAAMLFIAQRADTSIDTKELESFCGIDTAQDEGRLAALEEGDGKGKSSEADDDGTSGETVEERLPDDAMLSEAVLTENTQLVTEEREEVEEEKLEEKGEVVGAEPLESLTFTKYSSDGNHRRSGLESLTEEKSTERAASSIKEDITLLGPSIKQDTTPFGPSVKRNTTPFGPSVKQNTTPFGPSVKQNTTPLGPSVKQDTTPFGPSVKQDTTPFGPSVKQDTTSFGPSIKEDITPVHPFPKERRSSGEEPERRTSFYESYPLESSSDSEIHDPFSESALHSSDIAGETVSSPVGREKQAKSGWVRRALRLACKPFSPGGRDHRPPFLSGRDKMAGGHKMADGREERGVSSSVGIYAVYWSETSQRRSAGHHSESDWESTLNSHSGTRYAVSVQSRSYEQSAPQLSCSPREKRRFNNEPRRNTIKNYKKVLGKEANAREWNNVDNRIPHMLRKKSEAARTISEEIDDSESTEATFSSRAEEMEVKNVNEVLALYYPAR